jgi:hypothetical protein
VNRFRVGFLADRPSDINPFRRTRSLPHLAPQPITTWARPVKVQTVDKIGDQPGISYGAISEYLATGNRPSRPLSCQF